MSDEPRTPADPTQPGSKASPQVLAEVSAEVSSGGDTDTAETPRAKQQPGSVAAQPVQPPHARTGQPSTSDAGTTSGRDDLAQQLADLARQLQHQDDAQDVLDQLVATAVAMVPGAQAGTISLVHRRQQVTPAAATSDAARRFDELQTEVGQGPCLDAVFEHQTTRVEDLAVETTRWPRLAARAGEVGARSMLCFQLFVEGDNLGSLNLLSAEPSAFADESEHVGLLFASHSAVALAGAQKLEHVQRGLVHRDVIGQAKGILMERHKVTADQAFSLLARVSQKTNRKLHEVAADRGGHGRAGSAPRGPLTSAVQHARCTGQERWSNLRSRENWFQPLPQGGGGSEIGVPGRDPARRSAGVQ